MFNIIRADLYRIFKGKAVWIAIAVFLFTVALQVVSEGTGTIGIDVTRIQYSDEEEILVDNWWAEGFVLTGKNAPLVMADGSSDIIYFLLPFIVIIAAADFSNGTVKNLLSSGLSRSRYFMSKLILVGAVCVLLVLTYVLTAIVTGSIVNGLGGDINLEYMRKIAEVYIPQLYLIFAYACIGLFLAFVLKSKSALISVYIAYSLVPILAIMMLGDINESFYNLMDYEIVLVTKSFAYPDGAFPPDLPRALIIGAVYILGCTAGSLLLFRKSEIK